jgi:hypothetical protein
MAYHRLYGLFGFGGVIGEVLAVKVDLMDWKSVMLFVMSLVLFLVLWNSKFSLTTPFSCFCNWIRLTADVRTIRGGRPVLAGAVASCGEASVSAESVSMSDAWRRLKIFQLAISLGSIYDSRRCGRHCFL